MIAQPMTNVVSGRSDHKKRVRNCSRVNKSDRLQTFMPDLGEGGTPLNSLYGDVPLDWVWFSATLS